MEKITETRSGTLQYQSTQVETFLNTRREVPVDPWTYSDVSGVHLGVRGSSHCNLSFIRVLIISDNSFPVYKDEILVLGDGKIKRDPGED